MHVCMYYVCKVTIYIASTVNSYGYLWDAGQYNDKALETCLSNMNEIYKVILVKFVFVYVLRYVHL